MLLQLLKFVGSNSINYNVILSRI